MRLVIICALLLLGGAAEGQKKKANAGGKAKSIGKVACQQGSPSPILSGPIKGWMEKDCKPKEPTPPSDPSKVTPEALEAMIMKPMGEVAKCLLRKMGAMGKNGAPIRPKTVATFSSLFAGAPKKVATAKTAMNKCFDQTGQSLKTDKQWGTFCICILGILDSSCLTKEQMEQMMKQSQMAAQAG